MTDIEPTDEGRYELAVPFTCCVSQGGPYDDLSFAAGYDLGWLDKEMSGYVNGPLTAQIRGATFKQLDLLAMHRGWVLTLLGGPEVDPAEEEWVQVELTRSRNDLLPQKSDGGEL